MGATAEHRRTQIATALCEHLGIHGDATGEAFRRRFLRMAASPFGFFRGSTSLFYRDLTTDFADTSYLDEHSSRVWIHGDLHARNFGTYMNSDGRLVFDVNDFDEAYVGPYLWDLKRFAASVALIGHAKAFSDEVITSAIDRFTGAYLAELRSLTGPDAQPEGDFTLRNTDGLLLDALQRARNHTRLELLERHTTVTDGERRFTRTPEVFEVTGDHRAAVLAAFEAYQSTRPPSPTVSTPDAATIKDLMMVQGMGIGSAGLPSYNFLLEGHSEALDNDIIVYMKQAQQPAVARYVDADHTRYFRHHGHRTALTRRALQPRTDPWLGHTELDGVGMIVTEDSPYDEDLAWDGVSNHSDLTAVLTHLGRAVARMHAVTDDESLHPIVGFTTGPAILAAINDDPGFTRHLIDFAHAYAHRTRTDHQIFTDMFRNNTLARTANRPTC